MNGTIELTTRRLRLRRYRLEDSRVLYERFGCDPAMQEYSGWNPYATETMAEQTVQQFIDSYQDPCFYGWAIDYEGDLIGTIGAYDYDPEANSIELGLSIARPFWRKGFATEALTCVLRYLTEQEQIHVLTAWCAQDNTGSWKAMEKAGMRQISREENSLEADGKTYDRLNYAYASHGKTNSEEQD